MTSTTTPTSLKMKFRYFSSLMVKLLRTLHPTVAWNTPSSSFRTSTQIWTWEVKWQKHLLISFQISPTQSTSFILCQEWSLLPSINTLWGIIQVNYIVFQLIAIVIHVDMDSKEQKKLFISIVVMHIMINAWLLRTHLSVWHVSFWIVRTRLTSI